MAVSSIYSKLEQGAKSSGRSTAWFGRKKKERRSDPLLRYLHFARNSDEHGTEHVTHRNIPTIDENPIGFTKEQFGKEIPIQVQKVDSVTLQPDGPPADATLEGPNIVLRTVTDNRFHESCDPPKEHLGQLIGKATPQKVAALGLAYLNQMVAEAEKLVVPPA
jgi:hypothetical protein